MKLRLVQACALSPLTTPAPRLRSIEESLGKWGFATQEDNMMEQLLTPQS